VGVRENTVKHINTDFLLDTRVCVLYLCKNLGI